MIEKIVTHRFDIKIDGFPPGLIGGKYIKKFMVDTDYSNFGNHSNDDGSFIRFSVRIFASFWPSLVMCFSNSGLCTKPPRCSIFSVKLNPPSCNGGLD